MLLVFYIDVNIKCQGDGINYLSNVTRMLAGHQSTADQCAINGLILQYLVRWFLDFLLPVDL